MLTVVYNSEERLTFFSRMMPSMPSPTIEDMIHQRVDEERARGGLSFAPLYAFMATIAQMVRMDERQTILDVLPKSRERGRDASWNQGYDAAMAAIIRAVVERAHTH